MPYSYSRQPSNPFAAPPRPSAADPAVVTPGAPARPVAPQHGDDGRPAAVGHGHDDFDPFAEVFVEPMGAARPGTAEREFPDRLGALGRGGEVFGEDVLAVPEVAAGQDEAEEEQLDPLPVPPRHADLVTVEEAVAIFRDHGLPRHLRTVQKYCARKQGRALVCYQVPTENGIRYMIERGSILRFIGDAAQQAPVGSLDDEPVVVAPPVVERVVAPVLEADIFEHPYVKRLEGQLERAEAKNDALQRRLETVLTDAN
jgi:hypothetical protein